LESALAITTAAGKGGGGAAEEEALLPGVSAAAEEVEAGAGTGGSAAAAFAVAADATGDDLGAGAFVGSRWVDALPGGGSILDRCFSLAAASLCINDGDNSNAKRNKEGAKVIIAARVGDVKKEGPPVVNVVTPARQPGSKDWW
jgi:hypothetical protein